MKCTRRSSIRFGTTGDAAAPPGAANMDLLSPRPFWPVRDGLPASFPALETTTETEVAIIGGGISGALLALALAEAKISVLVLDRREVAHGSTAGNTGLMLYEIDVPLHQLARRLGRESAERVYHRCRRALKQLAEMVERHDLECGLARRPSLYLAARAAHVPRLRREFVARRAAGLELEWWSRATVARKSALPHAAGLLTAHALQLDPYRLTYGVLCAAQRRGARIFARTHVTGWKSRRQGVELTTARGATVRAGTVIVAAGYESERFLPKPVGQLHSTFAIISEPVANGAFPGWPAGRPVIWDTGDPYLYLRTTSDGRALIGGYDEPFRNPPARDRLLPAKAAALGRRFRRFFPDIPFEMAAAWAGTFGVTADGLPFIGRHPGVPHTWFALGFGGNGTTFSVLAAELIRDAILGREDPDMELFRFGR